jgi:uncharacterized membrane protein (DUF106 family)
MQAVNGIANAIFDVLMAPLGHARAAFDLLLWPVLMGVAALLVYKLVSNQKALTRVKSQISMHLLEIRLFSHDILQVLKSTGSILVKNTWYLGNHMLPMAVMMIPMVLVMAQLVANYAYAPAPVGAVEMLRVDLDPEVSTADVALDLPPGVALDAPAVKTADGRVFYRLRAEEPGDHVMRVTVGGEVYEKTWAVGGEPRKVATKRLRGIEAVLYPAEPALPAASPVRALETPVHTRELRFFPDGEAGIVGWFLLISLAAGFALRGLFGVTF